jgi:ribosome-associated translation inhibitor RaiA
VILIKEIELVNFESFDKTVLTKVRDITQPLLDKYNRMFGEEHVKEFKIIVDTIRKKREQYLYEVIGTLRTTSGFFRTKETGWKIIDIVEKVIDELERMVTEKKEKMKSKRKIPANA